MKTPTLHDFRPGTPPLSAPRAARALFSTSTRNRKAFS